MIAARGQLPASAYVLPCGEELPAVHRFLPIPRARISPAAAGSAQPCGRLETPSCGQESCNYYRFLPPFGRKELCFEEVPGGVSDVSSPRSAWGAAGCRQELVWS